MRQLFLVLTLLIFTKMLTAQVTMPPDKKFYKHTYYRLLGTDTMQISFLNKADRHLLPPLDTLFNQYIADYKLIYDTTTIDITARRVEYHYDERRTFVFFAPIFVDEYQVKDGKVYTVKHGKDTVSITGLLSNGRPYRVRFWVLNLRSMLRYRGKLGEMIEPKKNAPTPMKKDESSR